MFGEDLPPVMLAIPNGRKCRSLDTAMFNGCLYNN